MTTFCFGVYCVTGLPPSGLDGAAEADAGGGHRRQEGAGARTLSQVPLFIQTDKYAHQYMRQYSKVTRITRVEVRSVPMSLQTESGILIICCYHTHTHFKKKFLEKISPFYSYIVGKSFYKE
jgi:hypothetical protein